MDSTPFDLYDQCALIPYDVELASRFADFTCGEASLDDFFRKGAVMYANEYLGKSYCWVTKEAPYQLVALFSLSNDSVKTRDLLSSSKNKLQRLIANPKRGRSYPAVLIGRLAVNLQYQGKGYKIGTQVIEYICRMVLNDNYATACRFLVIDAYNKDSILSFYLSNGFFPLHKTEEDEKAFYNISSEDQLRTRLLYFDLKSR